MISKDQETRKLIEEEDKTRLLLKTQSSKFNYEVLIKSIDLANECELNYKNSNNKRLLVELTLMKISSLHYNGEKKN